MMHGTRIRSLQKKNVSKALPVLSQRVIVSTKKANKRILPELLKNVLLASTWAQLRVLSTYLTLIFL